MDSFLAVSPDDFVERFLNADVRPDGRLCSNRRAVTIAIDSISSSHGSAFVQIGETKVLAAVRGEIGLAPSATIVPNAASPDSSEGHNHTSPDTGEQQSVFSEITAPTGARPLPPHPSCLATLELLPLCSSKFTRGPPSELAQVCSERINEVIGSHLANGERFLSSEQLELHFDEAVTAASTSAASEADLVFNQVSGLDDTLKEQARRHRLSWYLYVDLYCIDYDGNVFDCALLATVAALKNTRLPSLCPASIASDVIKAASDPALAEAIQFSGFPSPDSLVPVGVDRGVGVAPARSLSLSFYPIGVSFALYKQWILTDPTAIEENLTDIGLLSLVLAQPVSSSPPSSSSFEIIQFYHLSAASMSSSSSLLNTSTSIPSSSLTGLPLMKIKLSLDTAQRLALSSLSLLSNASNEEIEEKIWSSIKGEKISASTAFKLFAK